MTKYRCLECYEVHGSEKAAVLCCNFPHRESVYICLRCGESYEFESEAVNCCYEDTVEDYVEAFEEDE